MSVGLGTAVGFLSLDISGFARGIDGAVRDMQRLQGNSNTMQGALNTVGQSATKVGGLLTAGITAPLIGAGAASVKFGTEFDSQMSNVKAVSGATAEEFDRMRESAIMWGEKTRYTATEAGEALYYMGLAGWDAEKSINGLGPVLSLAAAGNLDLGRTSDIVTDAMTALKLSAGELNKDGIENTIHFTNVLAAAMSNSNTDVDQMGEAFKYVAPLAGSLGIECNDLALALGLMANVGVKSSQAGTGLRQALNGLINPTDKAKIVMDNYGVSLFNADGSTKNFRQMMVELRDTFGDVGVNAQQLGDFVNGLGVDLDTAEGEATATAEIMKKFGHDLPVNDFEKLNAIIKIFGIRALPGVLGIIEQSDDAFNNLAKAIDDSDASFVRKEGQLYTMEEALKKFGNAIYTDKSFEILGSAMGQADVQMDNLQGDWYKFTSALGTSQILLSDMAKGALRDLVQQLTELVQWFNNLDAEQREQIVKWALMAAAIGPALLVFGKFVTGAINMYNNIRRLGTAFSVIGRGIGAVAGDIGAFISLVGENGLMATITGLTGVTGGMIAAFAAIAAVVAILIGAFVTLWKTNEDFRNSIIGIWEEIKAKFEEAGQKITEAFNQLGFNFEDFQALLEAGVQLLKDIWMGFCDLLAPVFIFAFDLIGNVLGGIIDLFVGIFEVLIGIVKGFKDGDWSLLWQGLGDIVMAAIDTILGILDGLGKAIWDMIGVVVGWFGGEWPATWDDAKQAVVDWFWGVVDWFSQLPGKIGQFFTDVWNSITTWWNDLISSVADFGSRFINGIVDWFSQLPGRILEFFVSIIQDFLNWRNDMIRTAIEFGTNFIDNIVTFFQELPYKIGYFIGYVLGTVVKWASDMGLKAIEVGRNFLSSIGNFFIQLPGKILEFVTSAYMHVKLWVVNMIKQAKWMAESFITNVVTFFTELPGKIYNFITTAYNNVVTWVSNMVAKAIELGTQFLSNIVTFFMNLPGNVLNFITSTYNNVVRWATDMVRKAKEMASDFISNVTTKIKELPGILKQKFDEAVNKAIQWAKDLAAKGRQAITDLIAAVKDAAAGIAEKVKSIGSDIVDGVWKGIVDAKNTFFNNVKNFFKGLVDGAKDALGIKSPSRVMANEIGRWLPPGIANGFVTAMPNAIRSIQNSLDDGLGNLDGTGFIGGFSNDLIVAYEMLATWFESIEDRINNSVDNMIDKIYQLIILGKDIDNKEIIGYNDNRDKDKPKNPTSGNNPTPVSGGNTYVFYTTKPIDELEAARLMRRTERDMAEGFA